MKRGVLDASIIQIADSEYQDCLYSLIDTTEQIFWCSMFIVDIDPSSDQNLIIDDLLVRVSALAWRGVEVKLIVGGSRTTLELADLAQAAVLRSRELGIPSRWLTSSPTRGSHMKLVIADDFVLTGSHNWTQGAFVEHTQDSVLVQSKSLSAYLGKKFLEQWNRRA